MSLKKELDLADHRVSKSRDTRQSILENLPKLKPLNCGNCGAGVLLKELGTVCPRCDSRDALPDGYAETIGLKLKVRKLIRTALRHWRIANVLTLPVVGWVFFLAIFFEPLVLFPTALIGANLFSDTWIDKSFTLMGESISFVIVLAAFLGFIVWMIIFIMLSNLSRTLRKSLPIVADSETKLNASAVANCESCGGGVVYEENDLACLCSYCNVVNYRVQFVRREQIKTESQKVQSTFVLFGAMEILDEFVGMFFFLSIMLVGSSLVLAIVYAIKNLI